MAAFRVPCGSRRHDFSWCDMLDQGWDGALRFASLKSLLLANHQRHPSTLERWTKMWMIVEMIRSQSGGDLDCFEWRSRILSTEGL
jgi:hypothetical protein